MIYAAIEDAIVARIKAAQDSGALGYRLATIGHYGGEFDDETFWTEVRGFPAVWVATSGESVERVGARARRATARGAVLVGSRSVRGERFARHGVTGQVGSYELLEDVRALVMGQVVVAGASALEPGAVRTLYNTRAGGAGLSVLSHEWSCTYSYELPDPAAVEPLQPLTELRLRYRLTPGDAVDDATDRVPLEGLTP